MTLIRTDEIIRIDSSKMNHLDKSCPGYLLLAYWIYMVSGYFGSSGLDNLIFWIPFFKQVINVEDFDVRFFFRKSFYVDGCWVTMMAGVLLVFRQIHKSNWNGENEKHVVYKSIW